jgi:hypothetical protein
MPSIDADLVPLAMRQAPPIVNAWVRESVRHRTICLGAATIELSRRQAERLSFAAEQTELPA